MAKCLVCENNIKPFMSFGKMPIANGFLTQVQFQSEYFFDMETAFCERCFMFQLTNQPDREQMFNEHYAFFSGTSKHMEIHFREFAKHIIDIQLADKYDPLVVEIGCKDGILIKNFAAKKMRHIGVEPSANVAKVAMERGINTRVEFFDQELAEKIVREHGQADALVAANVMCHIPYIKSIIEGIKILLKPDGIVAFEDPYLGDVINKTSYDQIYDEHTFLFSVHSIQSLFDRYEMEIIDLEPQETHGGSMRYIIAHKGARNREVIVEHYLAREKQEGLANPLTFDQFKKSCENSRSDLLKLINDIKAQDKRIVGYAATSKSTTILNYCGIGPQHLDFITDITPIKQGKFSPGLHIPVRAHDDFLNDYPDYALLFAYNHEKEILAKEKNFIKQGGQWIAYVPEIRIFN